MRRKLISIEEIQRDTARYILDDKHFAFVKKLTPAELSGIASFLRMMARYNDVLYTLAHRVEEKGRETNAS